MPVRQTPDARGLRGRSILSLALVAAVAACAARTTPSPAPDAGPDDEPPLTCVRSDTGAHAIEITSRGKGRASGIVSGTVRGTDRELVRAASVVALQPLDGGAVLRARTDSSGRFEISNVPAGSYELRIVSIGYQTSRDTVVVPRDGLTLELTQVIMRFLDEEAVCHYLETIDAEPTLTVARVETSTAKRTIEDGGSIATTLTVRPSKDGATFEFVARNVGASAVSITRLCYPSVSGDAVRAFPGRIGPACYGTGVSLAPGDTLVVRKSVQLRGTAGTHRVRVHAVDPPALDVDVSLPLVVVPRR